MNRLNVECKELSNGVFCEGRRRNIMGEIKIFQTSRGLCDMKQKGNLSVVGQLIDYAKQKEIIKCKNL